MLDKNNEYKPTDIADIAYGDEKSKDFIEKIATRVVPFPFAGVNGIILYGPNGTGKSALARVLPAAIENAGSSEITDPDYDFHRITAATDGKDLIEKIAYQTQFMPLGRFRYFVLDEFDILNPRYMSSMKSVMNCETAVFIMTTNNISKIDSGIKSRSHLVHMPFADASRWLSVIKSVLSEEGVVAPSDNALCGIVTGCKHDARKIMGATLRLVNDIREKAKAVEAASHSNDDAKDAA